MNLREKFFWNTVVSISVIVVLWNGWGLYSQHQKSSSLLKKYKSDTQEVGADKELEIKNHLSQQLKRGKANVIIELASTNVGSPSVHINEELFNSYFKKYREMAQQNEANEKDLFRLALHSPDVITTNNIDEILSWKDLRPVIDEAINKCNESRSSEGNALAEKLSGYINEIRVGLDKVEKEDPKRKQVIMDRLGNSLEEIKDKVQVDPNRFEQELIYYFEKLDITEEKVRLGRHLDYFLEVMKEGESQGKKLGFISQEIGREINTIGSKANDAVIQRAVVQMKDELEKIKEQSMNIL